MSNISKAVGTRFENFLQEKFPSFIRIDNEGNILPDFYNEKFGFWIEAKSGFKDYGIRPHKYQIVNFDFREPVIYAIGFHDLPQVMKELQGLKTLNGMIGRLNKKMNFPEVYFVTNSVIKRIWKMEKRVNEKGTIEYCVIKRRFLESIIQNNLFTRNGRVFCPEEYYGLSKGNFLLRSAQEENYGFILDEDRDKSVAKFLGIES